MKFSPALGAAFGITLTFISPSASSHNGGTNANGYHTNSRAGDYHCHTPNLTAATKLILMDGERRCGYAMSSCRSLVRQYGGFCSQ